MGAKVHLSIISYSQAQTFIETTHVIETNFQKNSGF